MPRTVSASRRLATGVLAVLAGVGFAMFGYGLMAEARSVRGWPTVAGVIVRSGITSYQDRESHQTMYTSGVDYAFEVDGRVYHGSRIGLAEFSSSSRTQAAERSERFTPGDTVRVYHDPADPSAAVLEPQVPIVAWVPLGLGVVTAGAGVAGVVRALRGRRANA